MTQAEMMQLMREALDESKNTSHWDKKDEWYDNAAVTDWKEVCKFKDRCISLFDVRWQTAKLEQEIALLQIAELEQENALLRSLVGKGG